MIRVRHYTRVSTMRKILAEGVIRARDQNRVFVEKANSRKLSANDARDQYGLRRGKGHAYIEFDIAPDELKSRPNHPMKCTEWFIRGDVILRDRDPEGFFNL